MLPDRLSDATTTPESPPQFRALEREHFNLNRDMKYSEAFALIQKKGTLKPLSSDLPAAQVFELVQAMALEMRRWEIAAVESGLLQLEAIASTRIPWISWIHLFKDDVVIQVRAEASGSSVHMRCKSRTGTGWLGVPSQRIRSFLRQLELRLA